MRRHKHTATRAFADAFVSEGKNSRRASAMSEPADFVSLLVALNCRGHFNFGFSNGQLVRTTTYPTIKGTLENLPARIDFVGDSEKSLSSITGWNTLYPEAVLLVQR